MKKRNSFKVKKEDIKNALIFLSFWREKLDEMSRILCLPKVSKILLDSLNNEGLNYKTCGGNMGEECADCIICSKYEKQKEEIKKEKQNLDGKISGFENWIMNNISDRKSYLSVIGKDCFGEYTDERIKNAYRGWCACWDIFREGEKND